MLYAIVAVLVLIIDQAVKYWVTVSITLNEGSVTLIPGILSLVNFHNSGAAFGLFQNGRWFFVGITAVVCIAIIVFLIREKQIAPLLRVALSNRLGGAIGNMIDRILYGYVVDMIHVKCIDYPVFNIADSATVIGTILLAWYILFQSGKTPEAKGQ